VISLNGWKWAVLGVTASWAVNSAASQFWMGVSTHAGLGRDSRTDLEYSFTTLGATAIRDELYWTSLASSVGTRSLDRRARGAIDAYSSVQSGNCLLLILDYGHPAFVDGLPDTDSERMQFAKYVEQAIREVKAPLCGVEIWNEWNIGLGRIGQKHRWGDPTDYAILVKSLVPVIRNLAPSVPIIVGAVADKDVSWISTMLTRLRGTKVDGISVHPYVFGDHDATPRAVQAWTRALSAKVQESYRDSLPIYVTEVGWPTHIGSGGVSDGLAAKHLVETYVRLRQLHDVRGVWWYGLKNKGTNQLEKEDNFGLTSQSGLIKPAGVAFKTLAAFWSGCEVSQVSRDGLVVRLMCSDGERLIVLDMSEKDARSISGNSHCEATDLVMGKTRPLVEVTSAGFLGSHVGFSSGCKYMGGW